MLVTDGDISQIKRDTDEIEMVFEPLDTMVIVWVVGMMRIVLHVGVQR